MDFEHCFRSILDSTTTTSITTSHIWSWWWWVHIIDITMIATSYPSIIFKRTIKFFLLRFPDLLFFFILYWRFFPSLKLITFSCRQSLIMLAPIQISLYLSLNQVRSSTHMAPNFREIRTLTPSSSLLTSHQQYNKLSINNR